MPFVHLLIYDALAFVALVLLPVAAAYTGQRLAGRGEDEDKQLIRRYWMLILRGWAVTAFIVWIWAASGKPFALLGLALPLRLPDEIGIGLVALALLLVPLQLWRLAEIDGSQLKAALRQIDAIKITPDSWRELVLFLVVAITAGVWEELLYRGFLLWYLTPHIGVIGAVTLSSLMFGLGHAYQGPQGVISTTILGTAFALLYLASGSLWWLMALHAAIDIQAGFVTFRIKRIAGGRRFRAAEIAAKMRQRWPN